MATLARDAGYDPVDAGPLWSAFNVEKVAAVMVTIAYVVGTGTDQALKIVGDNAYGAGHQKTPKLKHPVCAPTAAPTR